ncbi:MAG: AtpZ/AtpI family protein [Planctomycetaceae bacterium]|nr:hypothetical protein [Planctomycetota bacterium]MCQ3948552.1 hypothetical protein [Planctomycetota bacterium]NUO17403.1 AtpZ/AtpI family protein [Planctomycetaceae bacterium]GIK52015.1 MAG: hypothetical protein BroJett014_09880 [Planctomycetota bacterium]
MESEPDKQLPSPDEYARLKRAAEELREKPAVRGMKASGRPDQGSMQAWLRYSGLGVQFVAVLGLPIAGGFWLDRWLGTLPAFLVSGAVLGMAAAMAGVIRAVSRMEGQDERRASRKP